MSQLIESSGELLVRFLIPKQVAKAVDGKKGITIHQLRTKYKALILIPEANGPERVLLISATEDNVLAFFAELLTIMSENGCTVMGNIDCRLLVHQSQAGCLIGKGGSNISLIRKETGGKMKVSSNIAPLSTDRVCQIIGKPETILKVFRSISSLLKDNPINGKVSNYEAKNYKTDVEDYGGYGPSLKPSIKKTITNKNGFSKLDYQNLLEEFSQMQCGAKSKSSVADDDSSDQSENMETENPKNPHIGKLCRQITIPQKYLGILIGSKGKTIKELKETSKAFIYIDDQPKNDSNDCVITIIGSVDEILTAQRLMQKSVLEKINK